MKRKFELFHEPSPQTPGEPHSKRITRLPLTKESLLLVERYHRAIPSPPSRPSSPAMQAPEEISDISRSAYSYSQTRSDTNTRRSRSSSPSKRGQWDSPARYRAENLCRANIIVEADSDSVVDKVNAILSGDSSEEEKSVIATVAKRLLAESRERANTSAGETEWTTMIAIVINQLLPPELHSVQNRDWTSELKPPVRQPPPFPKTIPQKRKVTTASSQSTDRPYPSPMASIADPPAFPPPTTSQQTEPPLAIFQLKDPRPDICVGFNDEMLSKTFARLYLLSDLQDLRQLISGPHIIPQKLRFPFFIVENKSGATGSNLYQAQNQASVSGACALRIFQALEDLVGQTQQENVSQQEQQQPTTVHTSTLPEASSPMIFSLSTEGPVHELWVHWIQDAGHQGVVQPDDVGAHYYNMACIGIWRTTIAGHATELVRMLHALFKWAMGLREAVIAKLQRVEA